MFLVIKKYKLKKGYASNIEEKFLKKGMLDNSEGFIRVDIFSNTSNIAFDKVLLHIYWESKEAFINFEKSPQHIESHKAKKEKPSEILEHSFETYSLVGQKVK